MAPEVGEEAMRAYAHETNRLNRQRHSSGDAWEAELTKVEQPIAQIIEAITHGMFHSSLKQTMTRLETRKAELTSLLLDAAAQTPVILPDAASIYARKVAALAEPLNQPEDRREAAEALRTLIEKIVLMPGPALGEVFATLHGEQATIMDWAARQSFGGKITDTPGAGLTGVSVSVVAGARNHRCRHSLTLPISCWRLREDDLALGACRRKLLRRAGSRIPGQVDTFSIHYNDGSPGIPVSGRDNTFVVGQHRSQSDASKISVLTTYKFDIRIKSEEFNKYLDDKGLDQALRFRSTMGVLQVDANESLYRIAKAVIGEAKAADRIFALPLEISAASPRMAAPGTDFAVKVTANGQLPSLLSRVWRP